MICKWVPSLSIMDWRRRLKNQLMLVDVLIFSNNIPGEYDPEIVSKAIDTIKELVYSGKIKDDRIRASYDRIMALKAGL